MKRDVVPIGSGRGNRRGRIRSRGQVGGIPTRKIKRVVQNACHGEIGIGEIGVGPAPVPPRFPTDTVLGSFKGAGIHQEVLYPALGVAPDGKTMARPEGAVADRHPLYRLGTSQLDQVVPIANVAILD